MYYFSASSAELRLILTTENENVSKYIFQLTNILTTLSS